MTKSFKDLIVWQKSKDLAVLVYKLTEKFPKSELFGLTNQMRRSAISISSNIAESYHRFHNKEKKQFLAIAFSSGAELESQLEIAKNLFPKLDFSEVEILLDEVMKILNNFLRKIDNKK
ncbi:MAG: four helix bundle protein [Candidatus Parcubacteria bacterium]|nr:MAG: four helix bundle protein [Candidatus Parcubacteria bacterium]